MNAPPPVCNPGAIVRNPLNFDPLGSPSRAGFAALCRSLVDLYYLRTLLMRDVGIDDVGAEELAAYVSSSVCIQSLDLSFNQVRSRSSGVLV